MTEHKIAYQKPNFVNLSRLAEIIEDPQERDAVVHTTKNYVDYLLTSYADTKKFNPEITKAFYSQRNLSSFATIGSFIEKAINDPNPYFLQEHPELKLTDEQHKNTLLCDATIRTVETSTLSGLTACAVFHAGFAFASTFLTKANQLFLPETITKISKLGEASMTASLWSMAFVAGAAAVMFGVKKYYASSLDHVKRHDELITKTNKLAIDITYHPLDPRVRAALQARKQQATPQAPAA